MVGRFAEVRIELTAARAPEPLVRRFAALQQEHPVVRIEAINQGRDAIRHGDDTGRETSKFTNDKTSY